MIRNEMLQAVVRPSWRLNLHWIHVTMGSTTHKGNSDQPVDNHTQPNKACFQSLAVSLSKN